MKGLQDSIDRAGEVARAITAAGLLDEAKHFCHHVLPACPRSASSPTSSKAIVADDLWPLPTYQEMLFIK